MNPFTVAFLVFGVLVLIGLFIVLFDKGAQVERESLTQQQSNSGCLTPPKSAS